MAACNADPGRSPIAASLDANKFEEQINRLRPGLVDTHKRLP